MKNTAPKILTPESKSPKIRLFIDINNIIENYINTKMYNA